MFVKCISPFRPTQAKETAVTRSLHIEIPELGSLGSAFFFFCPCSLLIMFFFGLATWQEGRDVEICNSFELDYKIVNGKIQIDTNLLEVKQEQCVFSSSSHLG
jgi:hypothetical protein